MPTANVTHDITISDTAGTNKTGFMYARRAQLRQAGVRDAQNFPNRSHTQGEVTEIENDPRLRQIWSQDSWRGGIGGILSSKQPRKIADATKIDISVDGKIKLARELFTTTVDVAPTNYKTSGFATVGTEVWAFSGRNTYEWDYSAQDWNQGNTPAASDVIYRNGVEFGGRTFVPCWTASTDVPSDYIYRADGDAALTWTQVSGAAPTAFKYFAKSRDTTGDEILWGGYIGTDAHHIRSTTDPTNTANWSTAVEIGESDSEITGLLEGDQNQLLICKTNGLWTYSRSGIVENLTAEFEFRAHPDNFRGAHNWNGHILLPLGGGGLFEVIGNRLFNVSFRLYAPNETQYHGTVAAIHGNPTELFVLVEDTTNTKFHLFMAEYASVGDDPIDYHWSKVSEISYTGTPEPFHAALMSEGIPGPSAEVHNRVWVGVESSGSSLLPYFYPRRTDDQDGYTNDSDCEVTTVADDRSFRRMDKTFTKIDFVHNNLGAGGRQIDVEYQIDGGGFQTDMAGGGGTGNTLNSTGKITTLTFPAGTTGKLLELKFKPVQTSVTTTTPEIERFTVTFALRPDPIKTYPVNIYLADGQQILNGATESGVKAKLAQLRSWNSGAPEVTMIDHEETSRDVVFLPETFQVNQIAHESGRRPEYIVSFIASEV
ncbi:MAG: hypothetical protein GWN86_06985 [Desulfobacterales bacterium]|nr:hypothetical protein [Desulfobacterales bacterium]